MFKKLLKKIGLIGPEKKTPFQTDKDLKAVKDFIVELDDQKDQLLKYVKLLKKLRHEHKMLSDKEAKTKNLKKQIILFHKFLPKYRFFKEDTDVNAIRIKKIAQHYLKLAKKKKFKIYEKIKNNDNWTFNW